jgi:ketosteroid isomerase-like protein
MSVENVEVVRRSIDVMNRRDFSEIDELFDPEIEYDLSRNVFNPGVYSGREGLERLVVEIEEMWDDLHGVTEEIIDAGDKVVSAVVMSGKGKQSGVEVNMRIFQVWTLRDSRILRVVGGYRERSEALAAAGLSDEEARAGA